jgi:hypothetical protein
LKKINVLETLNTPASKGGGQIIIEKVERVRDFLF